MLLILAVLISISTSGQDVGKKSEINYSDPFQIDSSEYFMIPKLFDNDDKEAYGKSLGFAGWGSYTNIIFYNSKTNQTKKLFNQLVLISSFSVPRYYDYKPEPASSPNFLPEHILYLARTENFNGDKSLDSDDPVYLFLSTKTGDNLKQITPQGFHVFSWTVSKDKKMILVKGKTDKNGNKKFGQGDDDVYYRIDLNTDISKIKCEPISM
jgi:dipeptidyl aminopeptidase/acylaminoacyl peptidase